MFANKIVSGWIHVKQLATLMVNIKHQRADGNTLEPLRGKHRYGGFQ
jgi:hypothetical protein